MTPCGFARLAAVIALLLTGAGTAAGQDAFPPATEAQDHAEHPHAPEPQPPAAPAPDEHAEHGDVDEQAPFPPGLPPIGDEDRTAAFPELDGQHTVHDHAVHYFVLFDQLEWQAGEGATGLSWDVRGWVGRDINRFWFRTEGEGEDGRLDASQSHAFYGRAVARWWDVVVGVRQDVRPGSAQTWAAAGIQGLAPYWFEVEATAYVGAAGRTHFRFEAEYEFLLTNRLILQPLVETEIYGKADPEHEMGAGLSTLDTGLRLRYEFRREFAPYIGVAWQRRFFGTADLARAAGEPTGSTRLAVGLRVWF
jgi:copper resistance protein B